MFFNFWIFKIIDIFWSAGIQFRADNVLKTKGV